MNRLLHTKSQALYLITQFCPTVAQLQMRMLVSTNSIILTSMQGFNWLLCQSSKNINAQRAPLVLDISSLLLLLISSSHYAVVPAVPEWKPAIIRCYTFHISIPKIENRWNNVRIRRLYPPQTPSMEKKSYSVRQVHSSGPSGAVLNLSADREE